MNRKKFLYLLPAISYMGLIFFLSSRPAPDFMPYKAWHDIEFVHISEYAVLMLLLLYGIAKSIAPSTLKLYASAFLITVAYGISDELHQYFVPERFNSLADVISDASGALLAGAYYW